MYSYVPRDYQSFGTYGYAKAFDDSFALVARPGQPIGRLLFQQYRAKVMDAGLGGWTIKIPPSGVRKLVKEARENGLVNPSERISAAAANESRPGSRVSRRIKAGLIRPRRS